MTAAAAAAAAAAVYRWKTLKSPIWVCGVVNETTDMQGVLFQPDFLYQVQIGQFVYLPRQLRLADRIFKRAGDGEAGHSAPNPGTG